MNGSLQMSFQSYQLYKRIKQRKVIEKSWVNFLDLFWILLDEKVRFVLFDMPRII